MGKLIIDNQSDLGDEETLMMALSVIQQGRVSGTGDKAQYCYVTHFHAPNINCYVYATKNKASDTLKIVNNADIAKT